MPYQRQSFKSLKYPSKQCSKVGSKHYALSETLFKALKYHLLSLYPDFLYTWSTFPVTFHATSVHCLLHPQTSGTLSLSLSNIGLHLSILGWHHFIKLHNRLNRSLASWCTSLHDMSARDIQLLMEKSAGLQWIWWVAACLLSAHNIVYCYRRMKIAEHCMVMEQSHSQSVISINHIHCYYLTVSYGRVAVISFKNIVLISAVIYIYMPIFKLGLFWGVNVKVIWRLRSEYQMII